MIYRIALLLVCTMPLHAQTIHLFSHGLADTGAQAYKYTATNPAVPATPNERAIINGPVTTFDYPDATTYFWRVNFTQTDLAQKTEVAALSDAYTATIKENPQADIILTGLSRGASAVINFVAQEKPTKVKALILESPFDSLMGMIRDKFPNKLMHYSVYAFLSTVFFKYRHDGFHAKDLITKLPKDLPVLIICSDEDSTVPAKSTLRLAQKLKDNGHKALHVVRLKQGKHSKILTGPDGALYQQAVAHFYKRYNLANGPALQQP